MIYELLKLLESLILLKLTLPSRTVEISDAGRGDMSVYLYIHIFYNCTLLAYMCFILFFCWSFFIGMNCKEINQ